MEMLSRSKQSGMTFLGYVIVLGIIGFFAVMVMKLMPLYLEYQSVSSIMEQVSTEPASISAVALRSTIQKRLEVNNIDRIKAADFKIRRSKGVTEVSIQYDAETPFMGNLYFVLKFDKTVELTGS